MKSFKASVTLTVSVLSLFGSLAKANDYTYNCTSESSPVHFQMPLNVNSDDATFRLRFGPISHFYKVTPQTKTRQGYLVITGSTRKGMGQPSKSTLVIENQALSGQAEVQARIDGEVFKCKLN